MVLVARDLRAIVVIYGAVTVARLIPRRGAVVRPAGVQNVVSEMVLSAATRIRTVTPAIRHSRVKHINLNTDIYE
jgi:hypothetical protein